MCQNEGKDENLILTHPFFYFSLNSVDESFNKQAEEYGTEKAKSDLVVLSIAKAEGLEVTGQEMEDYFAEYAANYNSTVDQVKKIIPEDELKIYLLQQKVMDLLYDNAKITDKK